MYGYYEQHSYAVSIEGDEIPKYTGVDILPLKGEVLRRVG